MMKKILVVAAHPDDEVLGCGGAIARHVIDGDETHVVILAEGVTSRDPARQREARESELAALQKQARAAHGVLGTSSLNFHNFPDNRMDEVALLDVVKVVEAYLAEIQPDTVYCHGNTDLNVDHRIVCQAVLTATRPFPGQSVREVLAFEVLSASEWNFADSLPGFAPNYFLDISATLPQKIKAMAAYENELRDWPHPRSLQALEHQCRLHGSTIGVEAAERFQALRIIR